LAYVGHYVETLQSGLEEDIPPGTGKEIIIDMDAIADRRGGQPKPEFYYTTETQQTRYKCDHCGDFNDIRGRFGYCASCGWRNNTLSLRTSFATLRERLNNNEVGATETVRSAVSEFDACCRDIALQLPKLIPMKPSRRVELERLIFHDLESITVASLKSMFDVDLLRGLRDEMPFSKMMMHRRHVYEHNGGVADERYVRESGDDDAREGVLIRETQANAHRLIGVLTRIVDNFDADFHEIFPPTEWPIKYFRERRVRRAR
jgi:hypothetical protein